MVNFNPKLVNFNQKLVNFNWKLTSSFNRNPYSLSDSESDQNRCSNLDGLKSKMLMIQFVGPNRLSLERSLEQNSSRQKFPKKVSVKKSQVNFPLNDFSWFVTPAIVPKGPKWKTLTIPQRERDDERKYT